MGLIVAPFFGIIIAAVGEPITSRPGTMHHVLARLERGCGASLAARLTRGCGAGSTSVARRSR